jgi:transcriptional regulator with XRE-family HTH domain
MCPRWCGRRTRDDILCGMTDQPSGPLIARIRLGVRLRELRESRGLSAQQAAKAIRGSDSKISRVELGRHAARPVDVQDLLAFYDVTDQAEHGAMMALAVEAAIQPWWHGYSDLLPTWFQIYLGLEEAAESIRSYDTQFIPGLLQTDDYAAGLLSISGRTAPEIARLLEVRTERVRRFAAGRGQLGCVVDEAVLYRPGSDPQVLPSQLTHLRDVLSRSDVDVQVRPLAAGAPAVPAAFTIIAFADPELPDVVFTEQLTSASYLDRPADVSRYAAALEQLSSGSPPSDQTGAFISDVLAQLDQTSGQG